MRDLLLVGGGGFLGSVARFLLNSAVTRVPSQGTLWSFPLGTLTVNVIGCFVIGMLAAASARDGGWSESTRRFLFTGVLGGFTTFSAFGLETFTLLREGRPSFAAANVLLQTGIALLAVWLGYRLAA